MAPRLDVRVPSAGTFAPLARRDVRLPEHMFLAADGSPGFYAEPPHESGLQHLGEASPVPAEAADRTVRPAPLAARSGKWQAAIAFSLMLHVGLAAIFAMLPESEDVLIQGGAELGRSASGSASADQLAAGDIVDVRIVEVTELEAEEKPAAPPEPPRAAAPTPAQVMPDAPRSSMIAPEPPAAAVELAAPPVFPPAPVASPAPVAAAERAPPTAPQPIPPAAPEPVVVLSPPVEVLSSDAPKSAENRAAAPPATKKPPLAAAKPDVAAATEATVGPATAAAVPEAVAEAEPPGHPLLALEDIPLPMMRPDYKPAPKPKKSEAPSQPRKTSQTAEESKAGKQEARTSGSGGRNSADAKKGDAAGRAEDGSAQSAGKRTNTAAGNAAVSNYPGKVVSKLRRSLRYPAEARRKRLRGEAHVQFTVTRDGGVSGVRVVRSSGSPVLDQAALDTVRRAAPFPAIPGEAGRAAWPFTVPLAFTR
jgi:periplasmic protein TonB